MNLKAVIIDDEINSVRALEAIITDYCPDISIVGTALSADEGIKEITGKKPDILFLDVEMPGCSGFEMLEQLKEHSFDIIFVTAFNHYGIQAIKSSAVDYILKPVDIEELVQAVEKIRTLRSEKRGRVDYDVLIENLKDPSAGKIAIPTWEGFEYIRINEIIYLEADRSYCTIFLNGNKKITVSRSMSDIEDMLDRKIFCRIHKSFVINLGCVLKYSRNEGGFVTLSNGKEIMIARRKREEFIHAMENYLH